MALPKWWREGMPPNWRCPAWIKRTGENCPKIAGYGTDHYGHGYCRWHKGTTPVLTRDGYLRMAGAMGDPRTVDPAEAIIEEIRRTAGHVYFLEKKVADFKIPETVTVHLEEDGVSQETIGFLTTEQQRWYTLYLEERKRLTDTAVLAIKAGLADRAVRLAEEQGAMVAIAFERLLGQLQLTEEQAALIPDLVPSILRDLIHTPPRAIEGTIVNE